MATYTLFGQEATGTTVTSDHTSYTFGVQFSVSQAATLTGIWFYSASDADTGSLPATIALFAVTGQSLVHQETATWSGAAASGWVRAPFSSPPSLTASVSYKGAVLGTSGVNWYSATSHYWDSGAGSGGITSGPLSAPNNAGGDGGQDTFNAGGSLTYPDTSFNAANYWVDVEVSAAAAVWVPPLISQRSGLS